MKSFKRFFVQWIIAFVLLGAAVSPSFAGSLTHIESLRQIHILCNTGDPGPCPCPGC